MAEKTDGSFSYSLLDEENNIYLVKGDKINANVITFVHT